MPIYTIECSNCGMTRDFRTTKSMGAREFLAWVMDDVNYVCPKCDGRKFVKKSHPAGIKILGYNADNCYGLRGKK